MKILPTSLKGWTGVLIIIAFSIMMFSISLPYFAMDKKADIDFLKQKLNVYHIDSWRIGFYTHVFTSVLLLIAGITQFSSRIIKGFLRLHRRMGMTYLIVLIFFSGPGAFVMGIYANGGPAARVSFVFLTLIWMAFTIFAWYYVRKKDYIAHGEFMIRSYALTLSAITLRLYLYFIHHFHFGLKPLDKYIIVAWLSWVPNLIIAEILIRREMAAKLMKKQ